jgi:uncharacterized protein RhaS with RHS repeats
MMMATENGTYYPYDANSLAGNIVRITNAEGLVTGSFEYNAWGEKLLNQPPPEGTRFGFSAPAWIELKDDPDGVLIMTPTRTYHSGAGRFLQRDANPSSPGSYIYDNNRPSLIADPTGLQPATNSQGNITQKDNQERRELVDAIIDGVEGLLKDIITNRNELTETAHPLKDALMGMPMDQLRAIKDSLGVIAGKGWCRNLMQDIVDAARKNPPCHADCDAIADDMNKCIDEAVENLPGAAQLNTRTVLEKLFTIFYDLCMKRMRKGTP